jgi:multiple sugar transport system substrate-binding protein
MASEAYQSLPYAEIFAADIARAKNQPLNVANPQLEAALKVAIESVMLSGVTPEQALQTLRQTVNEILQD